MSSPKPPPRTRPNRHARVLQRSGGLTRQFAGVAPFETSCLRFDDSIDDSCCSNRCASKDGACAPCERKSAPTCSLHETPSLISACGEPRTLFRQPRCRLLHDVRVDTLEGRSGLFRSSRPVERPHYDPRAALFELPVTCFLSDRRPNILSRSHRRPAPRR